jgi:general L-amino acid transport system substrate-binding protein
MLKKFSTIALVMSSAALLASPAFAGKTLDDVKKRQQLVCGVSQGVSGMSQADSNGKWSGIDIDYCRAVAAAVIGDPDKVRYVPLTTAQRFTALQSGEIDILARNSTWTMSRDASLGIQFTGVTYYDGQGFMVPAKSNIKSLDQLKGATICVQSGTTDEKNLSDYSRANKTGMKPVVFGTHDAVAGAYFAGRCAAVSHDITSLASMRNAEAKDPNEHVILADVISKEPLGPAVRRGDDDWAAISKWVLYGLIEAEEYGITQANVDQLLAQSSDPAVLRILGKTEDTGKWIGLDRDWMARAIKASGNYGEMFERNVGASSTVQLPRGLNNLWSKGGVMYAPPIR